MSIEGDSTLNRKRRVLGHKQLRALHHNQAPELPVFSAGLSTVSVAPGVEVVVGVDVDSSASVCAVSDASSSTHPANIATAMSAIIAITPIIVRFFIFGIATYYSY